LTSQPKEVPLGDLLAEVETVNPLRDFGDREFIYVDLSAVDQRTKIISAPVRLRGVAAPSRARQTLKCGDIVVSTVRPNLNAVAQVGDELHGAVGSTGFSVLRPTEKLDRRYLFHWVRSPGFVAQMVKRATGASYPAVSDLIVRASRVPLVPLDEQQWLARILDASDALRAKCRVALERMTSLPEVVLARLLADSPGLQSRVSPVSEVVREIRIGPFGTALHKDDYVIGGVPVINPMHIATDGVEADDRFTVDARKHAELSAHHLREGDLILGRRGEMGRCAVIGKEHAGMVCGTGSVVIRPDPAVAQAAYLQGLLSSAPMRARLTELSLGATMPNLNKTSLGSLPIPVPPMELQDRYCEARARAHAIRHKQSARLAYLDALFASLQARAFSGEL